MARELDLAMSWVELTVTGETMPAYVAAPAEPARGGVIVIQEVFGVNADMQRIVHLLAQERYLAIAPAVFHRTDPRFDAEHNEAGIVKGRAAASAVDLQQLVADLTAAADYLRERLGEHAKIATWGFCFGGSIAFMSATLPFVSAAVSFYGGAIARAPDAARPPLLRVAPQIRAPLLLAFGGRDPHITPEDIASIRAALEEHRKTFDLLVYPEEDHAFFRHGPEGNSGSRQVWPRVRAFLESNVGS